MDKDKGLRSLVRLNEWRVDEQRRALAERQRVLDGLLARARNLEAELAAEQRIAAEAPAVAGFAYGGYAKHAIQRRAELAQAIAAAEAMVTEAREKVRAAYRELKKVEITARTRAEQARAERDRRDQLVVDEIALVGHGRATARASAKAARRRAE